MSKTTKKFLSKIKRKLTRVIDLHCSACGHEALVDKAIDEQLDLEEQIERALETLEQGGQL